MNLNESVANPPGLLHQAGAGSDSRPRQHQGSALRPHLSDASDRRTKVVDQNPSGRNRLSSAAD